MTEPTEIVIDIDLKHRAIRSGDRWAVQRRMPDGGYDTLETWAGTRHSLLRWLAARGIAPSRAAEARLDTLPESTGFRDRR